MTRGNPAPPLASTWKICVSTGVELLIVSVASRFVITSKIGSLQFRKINFFKDFESYQLLRNLLHDHL